MVTPRRFEHIVRVSSLADTIARANDFSRGECRATALAAVLHDAARDLEPSDLFRLAPPECDLEREHPVAVQEAAFYCQYLARAGYLVVTAEGGPNRATRFRLLPSRYSGPRAPQIQRIRQVWDANKQEVVWRPEDGGDE